MTAPAQTTTSRRPGGRARGRVAAAASAQRCRCASRSSRICLLWTLPTLGLLVTSVRDPLDITTTGWWTALLQPVRPADQWTLPNYVDGPRQRGHGQRVHQQPDRDHPVDGHPDHDRRVRRLRVRVDPVPRPRHPVHDRRRAARRAAPDVADPDPAAVQRGQPERHVPGHLAGAHRLRPAAGDLPALQLHLPAAARPVRVGRHRRRVALPDVHPDRPAAVGAGARRVRDLPVPVGLERPAGRAGVPRVRVPRSRACRRPLYQLVGSRGGRGTS